MQGDVERAAEILRSGGLVAFPTETVYGLGANALDDRAVERIFIAKGRPATSPLIVHVSSLQMLDQVVATWPAEADRLAKLFWPGPLSLVLPKRAAIPDRVTAGLQTVGVRIPAHPLAQALISAAGIPVAAPSANRFMGLSPTLAEHVRASLGDKVDFVLDGGPTQVGIESTVLSLMDPEHPELLRPGGVSRAALEAAIGPVASGFSEGGVHLSPGLHHKHYSPATMLVIGHNPSRNDAYLWWSTEKVSAMNVRMPADPAGYARQLYAVLHRLDYEGLARIVVEPLPPSEEWDALRDRLTRAAGTEQPEIA
ncbi:MAG TPA: L-threonylcarbamoyladenylate synthase [Bryobacteraceae bacterium]|nr:L-threonylcarbamoyladenylate synthase [Bryobacteraceae bacterium]